MKIKRLLFVITALSFFVSSSFAATVNSTLADADIVNFTGSGTLAVDSTRTLDSVTSSST